MKKGLATLCAIICALCCFSGCGGKETNMDVFNLAHYNGVSADGSTDSRYFYKNDFTLIGGDSQIIYVSEEQDATYGGWYYQYMSMCDGVLLENFGGDDPHRSAIHCFRSKDLNDWERVGAVDNGYSVRFETYEWPVDSCWAPEVIYNPYDQKYYMYFSAEANANPSGSVEYDTGSDLRYDRFFLAICVSETPVGPFKLLTSENYYGDPDAENLNGKVITSKNPAINPKFDLGLDHIFATIDAHPFYDDVDSDGDGEKDLYLYFVRHISEDSPFNSVWGMRMKDMISPDYDSARCLSVPNYRTVEFIENSDLPAMDINRYRLIDEFVDAEEYVKLTDKTGKVSKADYGEEYHINEAPFMWKDGGRYYLTYSPQGVGRFGYQVRQALGTSPLGKFEKPTLDPATIMGSSETNTEMLGNGHHCFIDGGAGDIYCVSWPNLVPMTSNIDKDGRGYAVDRIHFTDDETYGRIITGGPTTSLQYKPSRYTGRVNVATSATVTATNAVSGTEKYINDEMVVFREYYSDKEFASNGKTTVTLSFPQAVEISAILIYNSYDYYYAFDEIESILFHLTEKPAWFTGNNYTATAGIFDLPFNRDYFDAEGMYMNQGGASVASFNDIKVNKIEITVSKKLSDLKGEGIKISDIVVLGKGE